MEYGTAVVIMKDKTSEEDDVTELRVFAISEDIFQNKWSFFY